MVGAINKLYGNTWELNGATYVDGVFTFPADVFAMATCSMPNPIPNHIYYGSVEQKAPAGSSFPDRRFEWWKGDGAGEQFVFAYMDGTNDQWVRQSTVYQAEADTSGSWIMRNFTVNGTAEAYRRNPIIIDLTETFGAGNEPTAAWVDANMIPSANGDTIFFDVPSALSEISDKRRMMMAGGKKWADTPLTIYTAPNKNPTNGSIASGGKYCEKGSASIGGTSFSGIVIWNSGYFAIYNIDATMYRTLTISYECITTDGYILSSWGVTLGWGYSQSGGNVSYQQSKKPKGSSSSGTLTFDITDIEGNICIGGKAATMEVIAVKSIVLS